MKYVPNIISVVSATFIFALATQGKIAECICMMIGFCMGVFTALAEMVNVFEKMIKKWK